jgi:hypothetical protein
MSLDINTNLGDLCLDMVDSLEEEGEEADWVEVSFLHPEAEDYFITIKVERKREELDDVDVLSIPDRELH